MCVMGRVLSLVAEGEVLNVLRGQLDWPTHPTCAKNSGEGKGPNNGSRCGTYSRSGGPFGLDPWTVKSEDGEQRCLSESEVFIRIAPHGAIVER
jgi:hypothetical protein